MTLNFINTNLQSNLVTFQSDAQSNFLCPPPPNFYPWRTPWEELKMRFIKSNYPINLLNRLVLKRPSRKKLQLASQKIVYVGIKYSKNKSLKFARLPKIINTYYGVVKVVPYYKQVESYSRIFQTKLRIRCKTSVGVYKTDVAS